MNIAYFCVFLIELRFYEKKVLKVVVKCQYGCLNNRIDYKQKIKKNLERPERKFKRVARIQVICNFMFNMNLKAFKDCV